MPILLTVIVQVKSTSDKDVEVLYKDQLKPALEELGRVADDAHLAEIFKIYDQDNNGSVSFEEFKFSVRQRSKLEQWSSSLPIGDLVASCFVPLALRQQQVLAPSATLSGAKKADTNCKPAGNDATAAETTAESAPSESHLEKSEEDPLARIRHVEPRDLTVVCVGLMDGCRRILKQRIERLDEAYTALEKQKLKKSVESDSSVSKFAFSMTGGESSDFYNGLEARIGTGSSHMLIGKMF